jgi:hypothetical protein
LAWRCVPIRATNFAFFQRDGTHKRMITTELEAAESQKKKPRWRAPKNVRKPRRKIPKWTTPIHWDRATGELSGARPIPQPSYPAFRSAKFIVRGTEPSEPGKSEAVGKWFEEEYVPKSP